MSEPPVPPLHERRAEYQQMPTLLARIGTQMEHSMQAQIELKRDIKELRASVNADIKDLRVAVEAVPSYLEEKLKDYTRLDVFSPVRALVFGLIGLVLASVVGVLGAVIMSQNGGIRP